MEKYNIKFIRFLCNYYKYCKDNKQITITEYLEEKGIEFSKYNVELRRLKEQAIKNGDREIWNLVGRVSRTTAIVGRKRKDKKRAQTIKTETSIENVYFGEAFAYILENLKNGKIKEAIDFYEGPYGNLSIRVIWNKFGKTLTDEERIMFNNVFRADRLYREVDDTIGDINSIITIKLDDGTLHTITAEERKYTISEMISKGCPLRVHLFKQKFRRLFSKQKEEDTLQKK